MFDPKEFRIDSMQDAKIVLDHLRLIIKTFGYVSVADFLESIGISAEPSAAAIGWTSLEGVEVKQFINSYILTFSEPTAV